MLNRRCWTPYALGEDRAEWPVTGGFPVDWCRDFITIQHVPAVCEVLNPGTPRSESAISALPPAA